MYIQVQVKVMKKEEYVKKISANSFYISLKEPPANNKANEKIFTLLKKYFPVERIILKHGAHRSKKLFEII